MRNGKAFPHRVSAMIGNEQYEHLKKESEAHGYQIALIERWMLIPQNVDDLYAGSLDDADRMMRRRGHAGIRFRNDMVRRGRGRPRHGGLREDGPHPARRHLDRFADAVLHLAVLRWVLAWKYHFHPFEECSNAHVMRPCG